VKTLFTFIAITLLSLSGCLAQTEDPAPAPATCPAVACGWVHRAGTNPGTDTETCPSNSVYSSAKHYESSDAGVCWVYTTACIPPGTLAECVPEACRRTFAECRP
jgi:hypothetical protein